MTAELSETEQLFFNHLEEINTRLKNLETTPDTPPEEPPAEAPEEKGFLSKLVAIFIISATVLHYCKDWKAQICYILVSLGMRSILIWQLPEIIRAIMGA